MSTATKKAFMSFIKFVGWSAAAADIEYVANHCGGWHLPEWSIPVLGGALKYAATWVATRRLEAQG